MSSIVQLRYHQNAVCAYGGAATYLNNRLWYGPAAGVSGAGPLACARASLGAARAVSASNRSSVMAAPFRGDQNHLLLNRRLGSRGLDLPNRQRRQAASL